MYAALLKVFFRPAIFCMLPFNVASHLCCCFGVFAFFSGPRRSRTSQGNGVEGKRSEDTSSVEYYELNVDITSLLKSLDRIGQVK